MTVFLSHHRFFPFLIVPVFLAGLCVLAAGGGHNERVLVETDTLYHHVTIREYEEKGHRLRCMTFAGKTPSNQSCVDLDDPTRQVLEYSEMAFAGLLFHSNPRKILIIGLGGGVIPGICVQLFPYAQVDVVEIDPQVVDFAKTYFSFRPGGKTTVFVQDGRRYIRRAQKRYDVILLDAFNGDQIPFHLMTKEFFDEIKRYALEEKGVLISNVWFTAQLFPRQMATYKACFLRVHPFQGNRSGNVIVVATNRKGSPTTEALVERGHRLQAEHGYPFFDLGRVAGLYSPTLMPPSGEPLLTDDYAPVNYLLKKK